MTNGLRFLTAGLLVAVTAFAKPNLDEFYGVRLGMTQAQFFSAMKSKGFEKLEGESLKDGFCVGSKSDIADFYNVGCMKTKSKDSVKKILVAFHRDSAIHVTVAFEPTQSQVAMQGIIGKFGYPQSTSSLITGHWAGVEDLCLEKTCKEATWKSGGREALVLYVETSPLESNAIYLTLKDKDTFQKLKTKYRAKQEEAGKTKAIELGF